MWCLNPLYIITAVDLKQTVLVDRDFLIRAYYAGHVLGAAMFYAKVGDAAIVYTGDYNMTPDRHLGAAQIDRLQLDLVITESTYATTFRDSKYAREREFLEAVHKCVASGGKVLIPTFALGRAQELCMLLDDYWERMNLKAPIYFAAGLTIQANLYYKVLINWTSQKVKSTAATRNAFDFKNVHSFDRSMINAPGPCVLFATPGMISGGFSLEVFKQWAPCGQNLITLPGYCVAGTVGHRLMSAKTPAKINVDENTQIDVRCQIHQLSFSPHTDAKGIMDLVKFLSPKHVILVHGEKPKMALLKKGIESDLGIPCYYPANNETVCIPSTLYVKADASREFLKSSLSPNFKFLNTSSRADIDLILNARTESFVQVCDDRVAEGVLTMQKNQHPKIVHQNELMVMVGGENHEVQFACCCPVRVSDDCKDVALSPGENTPPVLDKCPWLHLLYTKLSNDFQDVTYQNDGDRLQIESVTVSLCLKEKCPHRIHVSPDSTSETVNFCCVWSMVDEKLAWRVISIMKNLELKTR